MTPELFNSQVRQVLEDGALLFVDPVVPVTMPDDADIHLQVRFEGVTSGVVRLDCHHAIGSQIARNMLGMDDGQPCPDELAKSSLQEILNILGGTVAANLAKPGQLRLHTPEPNDGFVVSGHQMQSQWSVEGLPLAVSIYWRES